jgi:hypothetical protein
MLLRRTFLSARQWRLGVQDDILTEEQQEVVESAAEARPAEYRCIACFRRGVIDRPSLR